MNVQVAGQVLVLFILMAVGFLSFKLKITTKETAAHFSSFVMKISLPCLIFHSFLRPFSQELLREAGTVLIAAFAFYAFSFLFCLVYTHILGIKGLERGVHRYALLIPNSGFMGYPVIQAVMGQFYLFHASIFNAPVNLVAFSIGNWFVAKECGKAPALSWKFFVTPTMVSAAAGFVVFFFSIPIPEPLEQSLKISGDLTTPLSMAVIGISIAQADIKQMLRRWQVYVTVLMRLLVLPFLFGLGCYLLGMSGTLLALTVILGAMPAGSTTSITAALYDTAVEEAGAIVALSTILSAVTIPLTVIALHYFGV